MQEPAPTDTNKPVVLNIEDSADYSMDAKMEDSVPYDGSDNCYTNDNIVQVRDFSLINLAR